jgi:transposase InsO family protein
MDSVDCDGGAFHRIHNAVDDHSRLAYSEILADEKQEIAAAFWTRAQDYFTQAGIIVHRVLTDNGSCYRSRTWHETLTAAGLATSAPAPTAPRPMAR